MAFSVPSAGERYYPATLDEGWMSLCACIDATPELKPKTRDDFSKSLTFSSRMSAWTSGQNFSAQVVPAGDGITVRISGAAKFGTQIDSNRRLKKVTDAILDAVGRLIQQNRADQQDQSN
jgi:hypothetical protein